MSCNGLVGMIVLCMGILYDHNTSSVPSIYQNQLFHSCPFIICLFVLIVMFSGWNILNVHWLSTFVVMILLFCAWIFKWFPVEEDSAKAIFGQHLPNKTFGSNYRHNHSIYVVCTWNKTTIQFGEQFRSRQYGVYTIKSMHGNDHLQNQHCRFYVWVEYLTLPKDMYDIYYQLNDVKSVTYYIIWSPNPW